MARKKIDQNKVNEERKENKAKAFSTDNKKIVKYSLIGLLAISLSAGAISLALKNDNKDRGKVTIESAKETKKETVKETNLEVSKELEKEINKEIEEEIKKIENQGLSKEDQEKEIEKAKENILLSVSKKEKLDKNSLKNIVNKKVSKRIESSSKLDKNVKTKAKEEIKEIEKKESSTDKHKDTSSNKKNETKEEKKSDTNNNNKAKQNKEVSYKYEDKETTIPYKTIRKHNIPNAKTRVKQKGVNGKTINTYKITLEDGKEVCRNISDTKTIKSQDEIIETYVKIQDKKVEIRAVEDKSKPVYRIIGKERWFVHNDLTGEKKYFYSAGEAEDYFINNGILGNWGTAESEKIQTNEILGYETKTENVVVQEEKWAWQ